MARRSGRRRGRGTPLSGVFRFTDSELRTMERRMHVVLSVKLTPEEREDGNLRRHNHRAIRWTLIALKYGRMNAVMGSRIMHEAYRAAWTAYLAAKALGSPEEAARRSAVTHAQIPLERSMGVLPETDFLESCDDERLSRLELRWMRARTR